jgi:hypothetical protein
LEIVMHKVVLFLAGFGLLSTAAVAEPAKLSEGELGRVAAGQGMEFSFSTLEAVTTTTTSSTTSNTNDADTAMSVFESDVAAEQSLAGQSLNSVSALGMSGSAGVSAAGNANAIVSGTLANSVP